MELSINQKIEELKIYRKKKQNVKLNFKSIVASTKNFLQMWLSYLTTFLLPDNLLENNESLNFKDNNCKNISTNNDPNENVEEIKNKQQNIINVS